MRSASPIEALHQRGPHLARRDLEELRGRERQGVGAGGRDDRLPDGADALAERPAAARVELGEHVVEQQERRHARPLRDGLRLGEQQREHGEALLALRAVQAQVAVVGEHLDVVAGAGPSPVDAALEVALEARLQRARPSRGSAS